MKIKKLLAMGLAAVMTVSMAVPAFAAEVEPEQDNEITVYVSVEKSLIYPETTNPQDIAYIQAPIVLKLCGKDSYVLKDVAQALVDKGIDIRGDNNEVMTADKIENTAATAFAIGGIADVNPGTYITDDGTGAFQLEDINRYTELYYTPVYRYYYEEYGDDEETFDFLMSYYKFMSGWNQGIQYSDILTGGDLNGYSGWTFTLNNKYCPGDPYTTDWYDWSQPVPDKSTVRLTWTNCGGQDIGHVGEYEDENFDFHYVGEGVNPPLKSPFFGPIDKDSLVSNLAIINGSSEDKNTTAYVNANNVLKDVDADQAAVDQAVEALIAAYASVLPTPTE